MHVGEDVLITKAILDASDYLRNSERIAAATAKFMDSSRMSRAASSLTALGLPMTALSASAIKTAASFQQQEMAFGGLLGSAQKGRAMFKELASFTTKTPFQLSDWTQATRTLLGWGMAADQIMPSLTALGNSEAAMGRTGADLQRAAYELGEMNSGFLSMKQVRALMMDGVPAAAALKKELHLTGEELANIGKMHIDGKIGVAAIQKYIAESNLGTGMQSQMQTLNGSVTSLKDNWNIFLASAGQPALKPLTALVNEAGELLATFQKLPQATQEGIGQAVLYSGPTLLAAGAGLKVLNFWRDLRNAKNLAKIATVAEDGAEKAKLTTFGTERTALDTATTKWKGLGTAVSDIPTLLKGIPGAAKAALTALGSVVGFQGAAEGATGLAKLGGSGLRAGTTLGAGLAGGAILSLPAIVAAGFARAIWGEQTDQANQQMRGFEAADLSPIINRMAKDRAGLRAHPNDPKLLHDLKMQQDLMARLSGHTARAAAAHKAAQAGGHNALIDDFLKNKAKYLHTGRREGTSDRGTEQMDFALDSAETRMKIAQINYEHDKATGGEGHEFRGKGGTIHGPTGHAFATETAKALADHKAYNAARTEALGLIDKAIAGHEKYAASLAHVAGKARAWLTEEKAILSLKEKRAGLEHDDLTKKGAGGFDKVLATILSSAGLSDEDILKQTGIGRGMFTRLSKGMLPHDPLQALLSGKGGPWKPPAQPAAQMARRAVNQPVQIHINLGGKELTTVTTVIENEVVKSLVRLLENGAVGTLPRQ